MKKVFVLLIAMLCLAGFAMASEAPHDSRSDQINFEAGFGPLLMPTLVASRPASDDAWRVANDDADYDHRPDERSNGDESLRYARHRRNHTQRSMYPARRHLRLAGSEDRPSPPHFDYERARTSRLPRETGCSAKAPAVAVESRAKARLFSSSEGFGSAFARWTPVEGRARVNWWSRVHVQRKSAHAAR